MGISCPNDGFPFRIEYFCFSTDTKMKVLKDSKQYEKSVSEIQKNDLVLTLNGTNKIFAKVLEAKKNEGTFEFYIF